MWSTLRFSDDLTHSAATYVTAPPTLPPLSPYEWPSSVGAHYPTCFRSGILVTHMINHLGYKVWVYVGCIYKKDCNCHIMHPRAGLREEWAAILAQVEEVY